MNDKLLQKLFDELASVKRVVKELDNKLKTQDEKLIYQEEKLIMQDEKLTMQEEQIEDLTSINKGLTEQVKQLKIKLNSKNSSKPPSTDQYTPRKDRSLRTKSSKKPGGQKGHKGNKLKMISCPDTVKQLWPKRCKKCATDLSGQQGIIHNSRQVFDIPPIELKVKEYQQISVDCPCCGSVNLADFPKQVKAATQYGSNLEHLIVYLGTRQFITINRLAELVKVLTGQQISQGTIANILERKAMAVTPVYHQILDKLKQVEVIGSDETGCKVNGEKYWAWVLQNEDYNFIHLSKSRGFETLESLCPQGLNSSTVVSDRWAAQLKLATKNKQLCIPHLVRNTQELIDRYQHKWAIKLKKVLLNIMRLCKKKRILTSSKETLQKKLDKLLDQPLNSKFKKIKTLQKSLVKNRKFLTTCLYNRKVPPDNNASERAIRNIKIKLKVSGGFRSFKGGQQYMIFRSIIDSAIKQGIHPFEALQNPNLLVNCGE